MKSLVAKQNQEKIQKYSFPWLQLIALSLIIIFPAFGIVQRHFGYIGISLYLLISFSLIIIIYKFLFKIVVTEKQATWLILAMFVGLVSLYFLFNYFLPEKDYSFDRDEALNIAVIELLHLKYPYYVTTHLDNNPISPFPGSVLLSIPFVLIGDSAYQNFFWMLLLLFIVDQLLKDRRITLFFFICILMSPSTLLEWVFGGDLIANNLFVLVAILWFVQSLNQSKETQKMFSAVFLGITMSSRPNFLFWLPFVFGLAVHLFNIKTALKYVAVSFLSFLAITLPFYLYDPQGFSPLHALGEISYDRILPHAPVYILFLMVISSLFLMKFKNSDRNSLLINGAIVQIIPIIFMIMLSSINNNHLEFGYLNDRFGLNFMYAGILGLFLNSYSSLKEYIGR